MAGGTRPVGRPDEHCGPVVVAPKQSWRAEAPRALGARAVKVKMRASILFYLKRAQKTRHAAHGGVV